MLTTKDKAAAFHISFCLAGLNKIKRDTKIKSREWNRIDAAEDTLNRLLDCYPLTELHNEDMEKAAKIFGALEKQVTRMYPDKGEKR